MRTVVSTVIATPTQRRLKIQRERITGSVAKRRATGKDLDGRRQTFTDSWIRAAAPDRSGEAGHPSGPRPRDVRGHP